MAGLNKEKCFVIRVGSQCTQRKDTGIERWKGAHTQIKQAGNQLSSYHIFMFSSILKLWSFKLQTDTKKMSWFCIPQKKDLKIQRGANADEDNAHHHHLGVMQAENSATSTKCKTDSQNHSCASNLRIHKTSLTFMCQKSENSENLHAVEVPEIWGITKPTWHVSARHLRICQIYRACMGQKSENSQSLHSMHVPEIFPT